MPTPAPVLVLLGGAGDLAMRMLLPEGLRIIGVGRAAGKSQRIGTTEIVC